ncbi:MAG: hypothetical protein ABEJ83_02265 [Candidatus Nanohaloarchaea archaeon]
MDKGLLKLVGVSTALLFIASTAAAEHNETEEYNVTGEIAENFTGELPDSFPPNVTRDVPQNLTFEGERPERLREGSCVIWRSEEKVVYRGPPPSPVKPSEVEFQRPNLSQEYIRKQLEECYGKNMRPKIGEPLPNPQGEEFEGPRAKIRVVNVSELPPELRQKIKTSDQEFYYVNSPVTPGIPPFNGSEFPPGPKDIDVPKKIPEISPVNVTKIGTLQEARKRIMELRKKIYQLRSKVENLRQRIQKLKNEEDRNERSSNRPEIPENRSKRPARPPEDVPPLNRTEDESEQKKSTQLSENPAPVNRTENESRKEVRRPESSGRINETQNQSRGAPGFIERFIPFF